MSVNCELSSNNYYETLPDSKHDLSLPIMSLYVLELASSVSKSALLLGYILSNPLLSLKNSLLSTLEVILIKLVSDFLQSL